MLRTVAGGNFRFQRKIKLNTPSTLLMSCIFHWAINFRGGFLPTIAAMVSNKFL